ncbi:MAG: general secretion pathway protein D [Myxococcota bacterium]|jgi:general secretion pathway protein D
MLPSIPLILAASMPALSAPADIGVEVHLEDAPLIEVVRFFAEVLDENFIVSEPLDERVTVLVSEPVSAAQARNIFLSVLASEGYTTVTVFDMTKIVRLD